MLLFCKFGIIFTFIYISFNNCKCFYCFTHIFKAFLGGVFDRFFEKNHRRQPLSKNIKNRHKTSEKGYKKSIKEPKNRLFYADFYKFGRAIYANRKFIFLHIYLYIITLRTATCKMPRKCKAELFPALCKAFCR